MSLRLVSKIVITQQPTTAYPDRDKIYTLDFLTHCEINSTWKNLTTTAKLIFPRNIYISTPQGNVSWVNTPAYVPNGNNLPPILLRGDRISISLGYYYDPSSGYITQINEEFNGFITKINPKAPIEIECEDNMWLLKQCKVPDMVFPATMNVQDIVKYCLLNPKVPTDVNDPSYKYLTNTVKPSLALINVFNGVGNSESITTNVGSFRTANETLANVLFRFKKDYKLECFFRKNITTGSWNDLYCSGIVYYPKDYINSDGTISATAYGFQDNIVNGNDLIYQRKEDVRLGIKAYSVSKYELTTTNSAGELKTKNQRLEVTVGDTDGDIRTQYFWPATNTDPDLNLMTLTAQATQRLNKMKYEGWRGEMMSFGLPYVQHGQAVSLNDIVRSGVYQQGVNPSTMERQGIYLVRGVKVVFSATGSSPAFSRSMDLHLRIDNQGYTNETFNNGL